MAVMHSIAHTLSTPPEPPAQIMSFINRHVSARYTLNGSFITAFYGIYDPRDRTIRYTSAGHTPPMVKRCSDGSVFDLDQANSLPLGIDAEESYTEASASFMAGDQIVLYTDGITEARGANNELFGTDRLDRVLSLCPPSSDALLRSILNAVEEFTGGTSPTDDRTIVIARVTKD
jgi:sigma-B regulation protein RsbU (phosphoserine phosphatase)